MKKIVIETTVDDIQGLPRSFWESESENTGYIILDSVGDKIMVAVRADDSIIAEIKALYQWYDADDYEIGSLNDYVKVEDGVVKYYDNVTGDYNSAPTGRGYLKTADNGYVLTSTGARILI